MKAIGYYKSLPVENPDSLQELELEKPTPSGRDLLVKVRAVSVNPVDVKIRASRNGTDSAPVILGWDVSGTVESVGDECRLFQPGDDVFYAGSITRPGGNSEFHLVDERIVGKKPRTWNFAEAAALSLTGITAWEALFDRFDLTWNVDKNRGKTILIVGAAGGVGSIAVQLSKLAGLTVIGTASREESSAWVKKLGADHIINHHESFIDQLQAVGLGEVDFILCLNDTEGHWQKMADAVAPQGKICSIVGTQKPLDLTALMSKSVTFAWELMFTRPQYQTPDMIEQHKLLNALSDLADEGKIVPTLTERWEPINAANLREAHAKIETGSMIGKLVLEGFGE